MYGRYGFFNEENELVHTLDEVIDKERMAIEGMTDGRKYPGPFERERLLVRSPAAIRFGLKKAAEKRLIYNMPATPFMAPIGNDFGVPPASQTAVGNTNVETSLWTLGATSWTQIPYGDMKPGRLYQVNFGGIFSTSSAAPTATWTPRIGSSATATSNVTLGASTGTTMTASLANVPIFGEFLLGIRSITITAGGATGTGNGYVLIGDLTTAAGKAQVMGSTVATTIDNTVTVYLHVDLTWGTQAAANTATCQWVTPVRSLW